ncbi:hypothetical protein AMECASPLE_007883 [Ameca splendens]|uniref:Uncharacterized protein n=1 Tax=Ameca splendens TaxID=208324 RepID=A0ABV0Z9K5_9TELE
MPATFSVELAGSCFTLLTFLSSPEFAKRDLHLQVGNWYDDESMEVERNSIYVKMNIWLGIPSNRDEYCRGSGSL